jgi:hypothetical protein
MNKARIITTTGLLAGLVAGIPAWAQTNAPAPTGQPWEPQRDSSRQLAGA